MKIKQITRAPRFAVLFVTAAMLAIFCVGCNTVHGFGKDMEKAGEKIQEGTK